MLKKIFFIFALIFFLAPTHTLAAPIQNIFSAEVVRILEEKDVAGENGEIFKQQDIELRALDGELKGKTINYEGIGGPESVVKNIYKAGDRVSVQATADEADNLQYFITDYVRTPSLAWLAIIFVISLLAVGRFKGLRSLISLALTFAVIMKYILPQIMDGADPVITTLIGAFVILLSVIYLTEGFNRKAHLAVLSILLSLVATVAISYIFVNLAHLTGLADEEASFLAGFGSRIVNFQGLLLAGIIIGALGVLDDMVISQITAVEEITNSTSGQSRMEIFKKSMNIGVSHISSMTNTLFLAYAGASLPLLILFLTGQSAFASASQALNNEALATEIIRTLSGSIGLILSMPLSTLLAVWLIKEKS
ncbi:MAG: YibE/F family protein [Patescibacteria group bacterium]|jgi:uncharacterized membrane protein